MSLVLSSDSRASASDDDLPVPPQRGANNTIQRQPPREASHNSQVNSQVGPVRRAHGHTRHSPAPPATGLPRSTANPMRLTSNQARSPAAGSVQNRNPAGTENRAARILSAAMWPPAGIGMEHVDGPINEEFITEVDELFALSGNYSVLGEELAHVPAPRQYVVSVYGLLAVRQAIDRLRQDFLTIPPTITQEVSGALHARNFHYVAVFNDFVKRKIRTLLMSRSLAVYGSEKPRDAPRRVKSMLALVLEEINGQNNQFKRDYLPRGYIEGEPAAISSVDTFVRGKLRNSRGKMRDMLLTNIQATGGREITHPVPTISALLVQMKSRLIPTAPGEPEEPAPRGNETLLKARLAYLRIQTISQYVGRGGRDTGRQWRNIDEHLCAMARKGRPYRSAFYQLVLSYDNTTFGQEFFSEMNGPGIALPTEEEILARVASDEMNNAGDDTTGN